MGLILEEGDKKETTPNQSTSRPRTKQSTRGPSNLNNQSHPPNFPSIQKKNSKYFNNLNIWYTNADTLTSHKISELTIRIKDEKPDVICVTEIYPKNSEYVYTEADLQIEGYTLFRTENRRG